MTINPEHLLAYPIPEIRQQLTRRDAALYALSIGLGQQATDARQLAFVDPRKMSVALPSMAVVLGHPGFWLGRPDTGIDAVRLVHGEQEIELFAPLPVDGAVLGRTRVTGVVDKGPDKGALLYAEKEISDAQGRVLAITRSTTVLRGDGGFGGSSTPLRVLTPEPPGAPDTSVDLATRPEQALLYQLNGDDNPLHADPAVAAKAGFPRPILHGLGTFGVVFHALLRTLGEYDACRFRGMRLRFSAPVYPGETIRTEIWNDGAFRARVVERDVVVISHGLAVFGESM